MPEIDKNEISPFTKTETMAPEKQDDGARLMQPFTFLKGGAGDYRPVAESSEVNDTNPKDVSAMGTVSIVEKEPSATKDANPVKLSTKTAPLPMTPSTPPTLSETKAMSVPMPAGPAVPPQNAPSPE